MTASSEPDGQRRTPCAWPLLGLLALAFVAFNAAVLALPHDPYIRYQQLLPTIQFRSVWGYERTVFDKTPIDIAIIGNSRLEAGVSAPALSAQLAERLGHPVRVANLSMPQEGRNTHFVIAKRLLEHHPEVKLIILSAIEQMPREGHPAFRNIADTGDVLRAPVIFNTAYFSDLAYLPWRQLSLFVRTRFPRFFGDRSFADSDYVGDGYDSTTSFTTPTGNYVDRDSIVPERELRAPADRRAASITPPLLPAALASREFAIDTSYTEQIVALARRNGTKVAFLYLPIFAHPMPVQQQGYYTGLGPLLPALHLSSHPDWYSDYGHLNRRGSAALSRWLGDRLVEQGLAGKAEPFSKLSERAAQ